MFSTISSLTSYCDSGSVDSGYSITAHEEFDRTCIELALVIVKPEAYKYADLIEKFLTSDGFTIVKKKAVHLTAEQASDFYFQDYGKPSFPAKVCALSQGPIVAFCVARKKAIQSLQYLLGPYKTEEARIEQPHTLRARFGTLSDECNGLHGSDSLTTAEREIHFFFPEIIMSPMCSNEQPDLPEEMQDQHFNQILDEPKKEKFVDACKMGDLKRTDYLTEMLNPTLTKGLVELSKSKPADPIIWLADWLLNNNPYQPQLRRELQKIPT